MADFKTVFKRFEKKYLITDEQYNALCERLGDRLGHDKYSYSTILNIYFDTPDFKLIRESLGKPIYKEKLRLRCYGVPTDGSTSFVELKKKYKGVVYKRRIDLPYSEAYDYLVNGITPASTNPQILREIDWVKHYYSGIAPAMLLSYDRTALFLKDDPSVRITFDTNLTYRTYDLDLRLGVYGEKLLDSSHYITEIKVPNTLPLDICRLFDELKIFPSSYSKYGNAFKKTILDGSNPAFKPAISAKLPHDIYIPGASNGTNEPEKVGV